MPVTTKVVSCSPVHGEVYSIGHYAILFISDLRQVSGFLHQYNWQARYSWNIVESGVKHHNPYPLINWGILNSLFLQSDRNINSSHPQKEVCQSLEYRRSTVFLVNMSLITRLRIFFCDNAGPPFQGLINLKLLQWEEIKNGHVSVMFKIYYHENAWGLSCSWLYGSWIYNYQSNQSPLKLWVWTPFMARCA